METLFKTRHGEFALQRLPLRKNELLRAWDAADEYLLETVAPEPKQRILILNDSFGALALALSAYQPVALSDSFLSQQATRSNLALNAMPQDSVTLLTSLQQPDSAPDVVLIKIPKTLALLEYQLLTLRPLLTAQTQILAAGMMKALPASVWKLFQRLIGNTDTALAKKKAKLIRVQFNPALPCPPNPYPVYYPLEHSRFSLCNHANVFSRDSLDIGTRFLLQHLPEQPAYRDYIDLGCGNGVVGLLLAERNLQARLWFVDESFMALASARENFQAGFACDRAAEFIAADGLNAFPAQAADCIVCNPPFHQQHVIGDQIAWAMFKQSLRVLRHGGELRVIGNRHLNYHLSLKKLFGHCETVAANAKFVILSCRKNAHE